MLPRPLRFVPAALLAGAAAAHAQQAAPPAPMPGFSPSAAARERSVEAAAVAAPSPEAAGVHSRTLSARTHVAGSPEQLATRDYVLQKMREWGLVTESRAYTVWLPHATEVRAWRIAPDEKELPTAEPPVPGDSVSALAQYPPANGSSAAGDVRGEVVYANYGLVQDFAKLDSMGVSVRGKIVVARYGRSFRGIKAREAERRGAAGLIIYSDPADDGYVQGDVYPAGPMRPEFGVQRGSVFNGAGDPSTPGYASVRGARRIPERQMEVPHIPVIALSYGNAAELLRGLAGRDVPQAWQGGLPFRYHVGAGPVQARIVVKTDSATAAYKEIWDTFGTIRGSELPDEMVVIGAHRDGWGPGAADNVSGVASVLEMAHAVAEAARAGNRPRRTIVFATWDAEEWGLVGSTEYVEQDSARLANGAVAYLNQDVTANGPRFDGAASPSLRALLRDVARIVPSPDGEGTVYSAWRRAAAPADSAEPALGDPGGGSDFAGFYNHLGIPHADWGFGGKGGVYHSQYDDPAWMARFGDPGYKRQTASARVGAAMALRLANADLLPYDYQEFARTLKGYLPGLDSAMAARRWQPGSAPIRGALDRMERAAAGWAQARDAALAGTLTRERRDRANRALMRVERVLARPSGLKSRPWYRNLVYASDIDNGYSTMVFPGVGEAVRAGDQRQADLEIGDLAARINAAAQALVNASEALTDPAR